VAIVPSATVIQEVRQGTLAMVPFRNRNFCRPLAILHRKGRVLSPAMRKFMETLTSDGTSRKPAGRANPLKGLYHCWSCGFGGDIFDVVRRYLWEDDGSYTPFEDSVMWLEEAFPAEGGDDNPWGT